VGIKQIELQGWLARYMKCDPGVVNRGSDPLRRKWVTDVVGKDPLEMVGCVGIEPTTSGLKVRCSTD
jgi:hypothetical protein